MPQRAPRNRTLTLSESERVEYAESLCPVKSFSAKSSFIDKIFYGDSLCLMNSLPDACVDLVIADPPYNMTKIYAGTPFRKKDAEEYENWLRSWLVPLKRILKPAASLYVCSEWQSSCSVERVLRENYFVRSRITWEREKGRASKNNWKNASEDIWFCTVSEKFDFHLDAVKIKRRVIAPYRDAAGDPKDWKEVNGAKYRETAPSNLWTDISVPFWSMPENTEHPTQKPEKLFAKLILASSVPGNLVLDPFLGSGTSAVTAHKLGRRYLGIEREKEYCLFALKRLKLSDKDPSIQGYSDGCFWERNSGK